ncbi:class I SAM-dependent methyltransferase [Candidatus Collierbacteria bacterium]|nr:class I SAM-dependent methyltransferase [Candidatus Collierbacteria bacterium]
MKRNPNTADFWDALVEKVGSILPEDYITKDRIRLITNLIPNLNIKVLDIGVGYGFLEKELVKSNVSVYGIDISFNSIFRAKSLHKGIFIVASAKAIPFQDNFFDVVCLPEVLEHLYDFESTFVMKEISRILKKDGRLIISVPLYDEVYLGHPSGHVRIFTPEKLFKEVSEHGFTVITEKYLFAFKSLYLIKSLINRLLKIRRANNLIMMASKQ